MDSLDLKRILEKGYVVGEQQLEELREVIKKYPYFEVLRIVLLRSLYGTESFEDELKKNIVYISDRRNLYSILYEPERMIDAGETEVPEGDRTVTLIDSFLDSISRGEVPCEAPGDYASYMLSAETGKNENEVRFERGNDLIDNFIEGGKSQVRQSVANDDDCKNGDYSLEENNIDDACFTETLAKIYIKQQRYDKAVEIIRKLSLKYPKKNIYFANQLKELEKLIINNKIKE